MLAALTIGQEHPVASPHVSWWVLALAFAATEVEGMGRARDRLALSAPTSRIALVIGLYLADPTGLIVAHVLGGGLAAALRWRAAPRRTAYALSASTLATTLGVWTYLAMTDVAAPRGPEGWADGLVAAGVVVLASAALGVVVHGRERGSRIRAEVWVRHTVMADVFGVATGLVAAEILRTDRYAVWLLVLPGIAAYAVRRQYELAAWRADALGMLHDVAGELQRAADRGRAIGLAVAQARAICRATHAEIVLREPDGSVLRCTDDGAGPRVRHGVSDGEVMRLRTLTPTGGAVVVGGGPRTAATGRVALRGPAQVVRVPIIEQGAVLGYLELRDRVGGRRFSRLEIGVLETLVASLGAALETIRHLGDFSERQERDMEVLRRLDHVNRELSRVSDAKSVFLATTSHELRAPLTALLAETEVLDHLLSPAADDCRMLVQGARSNAQHLLRLVDDLLDLSRIEAGRLTLLPEPIDLHDVARDVVRSLRPVVEAEHVELLLGEARPAPMNADRGRLWQVIANLVDNACNATPPGGRIRVEVTRGTAGPRVSVTDTGSGIPSDQLGRMFGPFEQGPDRSRGLGLGLTIARHLVEAHGGTLSAVSEPGRGSRFTASFPDAS